MRVGDQVREGVVRPCPTMGASITLAAFITHPTRLAHQLPCTVPHRPLVLYKPTIQLASSQSISPLPEIIRTEAPVVVHSCLVHGKE